MSECTTCSYYGKHLDGRAEDMPWPCVECAGGEKYVERGKRRHQVPLRVQLAELEARHNALREAVGAARRQTQMIRRELPKTIGDVNISLLMGDLAEVGRLIANETSADCKGEMQW